ncbi:hypothetical protein [Haladaptatus halobius]|uniref:hypothetical protein n=1 Tax=Haladaptatus halobius TaxID=2884875 RepID=UPI001D09B905|nr:hypothetical protein [Haladaptatus halobius]
MLADRIDELEHEVTEKGNRIDELGQEVAAKNERTEIHWQVLPRRIVTEVLFDTSENQPTVAAEHARPASTGMHDASVSSLYSITEVGR